MRIGDNMTIKTTTAMLSIVLMATALTGCSVPENLGSIIELGSSQKSNANQTETAGDSDQDIAEDSSNDSSRNSSKNSSKDSSQDSSNDRSKNTSKNSSDDSSDDTSTEGTAKTPTFSIAYKDYSIRYDGDATFDESNENSVDYSNGILFEGSYQFLMMDDEWEEDYPQLYEAVNSYARESMAKTDGYANNMADEARQMLEEAAEGGYSFWGPFTEDYFVSVTRIDDAILSVYNYSSEYTGGAHGMYGAAGDNYDVETGEMLDISDVLDTDEEEFDEVLKDEILALAESDDQFQYIDEALDDLKFDAEYDPDNEVYEFEYKWYFAYDGLHVIFNPYELGSYGDGMQDVVIGYDEYPDMIKEKFVPAQNTDYIYKDRIYFVADEYDYDNNPDLHFRYTPDDDYDYQGDMVSSKFELVKDGKSAQVDGGFYVNDENDFDIYRVVTADGCEYVYLFVPTESEHLWLVVFDITGDVKLVDTQGYYQLYSGSDDGYHLVPILTDPYDMRLGHLGQNFGSYICYGDYEVGADGLPNEISEFHYILDGSEEVYSKADIKADVVDTNGEVLEQGVTIPKGQHFVPYRTDAESYMDLYLDDGRIVRLTYEDFYSGTIPEGKIGDLFEGLLCFG